MKYIKTYETTVNDYYKVVAEVNKYLTWYKVGEDFVVNKDFSVSFLNDRGLYLNHESYPDKRFSKLPFKIRDVKDHKDVILSIEHNNLITLEGCPDRLPGNFWCDNNKLITLKGGPEFVGGSMSCYKNELSSLEYLPKTIGVNPGPSSGHPHFLEYGDNPCWNDENQLKYLPFNLMLRGSVHNIFISSNDIGYSFTGGWMFIMKKDIIDEYWREKIEEDPDLILENKLYVINNNWELSKTQYKKGYTYRSNEISNKLYKKLKFLIRGKNSGLWDFGDGKKS